MCFFKEGAPFWEVPLMVDAPLWVPFMGCASLRKMLLSGRCPLMADAPLWVPFMGCASLRKVLLSGRSPLWVVPLYRKCPIIEGTPLREVPLYGRYPFMRIHERCTFIGDALMECVPLWEVPFYDKCSLLGTELPHHGRYYFMNDDSS